MRTLLGTGTLTWDAMERRTDRYGSVHLKDGKDNVLIDRKYDNLQGMKGKLIALVKMPVKSFHLGDLFRGFVPSTPELGEEVLFGEGYLFIEHRNQEEGPHELGHHERIDKKLKEEMQKFFEQMGIQMNRSFDSPDNGEREVWDVIGLVPEDGRQSDWLNPKSFYRTHLSLVELYFEPTE